MLQAVLARYRIETCLPLQQVAETLAGEPSSGTLLPVPGEIEELKSRARANVVAVEPGEVAEPPSVPGGRRPQEAGHSPRCQRAGIVLEFRFAPLGANLPTLVATVHGKRFEPQRAKEQVRLIVEGKLPEATQ